MTSSNPVTRSHRILCVDDEPEKLEELKGIFGKWRSDNPYGHLEVITESSFENALGRLASERFDLMTLDLSDGFVPGDEEQAGQIIFQRIQRIRFLPVIFYTGFADKISELASPAVKIITKGRDDMNSLRKAATEIFATGLPKLIDHIDEEVRRYMWETIAAEWATAGTSISEKDLAYLMARRLASGLSSDSVKSHLGHPREMADGIEHYIYPPLPGSVRTGEIVKIDGDHWVVVTPACDFPNASRPLTSVLLVGAKPLTDRQEFRNWNSAWSGDPLKHAPSRNQEGSLANLLRNRGPDRYHFLPGTFFIPDLLADFQMVQRIEFQKFSDCKPLCRLDSPFRQEFMLAFSRYLGRLGTPDLDTKSALDRLVPKVQPTAIVESVAPVVSEVAPPTAASTQK